MEGQIHLNSEQLLGLDYSKSHLPINEILGQDPYRVLLQEHLDDKIKFLNSINMLQQIQVLEMTPHNSKERAQRHNPIKLLNVDQSLLRWILELRQKNQLFKAAISLVNRWRYKLVTRVYFSHEGLKIKGILPFQPPLSYFLTQDSINS